MDLGFGRRGSKKSQETTRFAPLMCYSRQTKRENTITHLLEKTEANRKPEVKVEIIVTSLSNLFSFAFLQELYF